MTGPLDHAPLVSHHPSRRALGRHAGAAAADALREALAGHATARIMLASAPSQAATLAELRTQPGIDWHRVTCFHMDEYLGLPPDAPQGFGNWLQRHLLDHVPAVFHRIDPVADQEAACRAYERLMGSEPFDLVLLGLGVNGHLAFNDPPADLTATRGAQVVALDSRSRQQQVDEGHFATIDKVPTHAVTVTIPRLLNAHKVIASVPGAAKRQAVADTLHRPIGGDHPGTALRTHPAVLLALDAESDPR